MHNSFDPALLNSTKELRKTISGVKIEKNKQAAHFFHNQLKASNK